VAARSIALANEPALAALVQLSVQTPGYRLLCWQNTHLEMQALIEAVGQADLKRACQAIWDSVQDDGSNLRPVLSSLETTDEATGRPVLVAKTGFGAQLGRRATLTAIGIGVVSLVVLIIGLATFAKHHRVEFAAGSAPALTTGAIAFVWALIDALRGRLVWLG